MGTGATAKLAQAWQQIMELTPDNVWGYMNVGAAYFNIGQFEKADEFFVRAYRLRRTMLICLRMLAP